MLPKFPEHKVKYIDLHIGKSIYTVGVIVLNGKTRSTLFKGTIEDIMYLLDKTELTLSEWSSGHKEMHFHGKDYEIIVNNSLFRIIINYEIRNYKYFI